MIDNQEGWLERIVRDVKIALRFAGPLTLVPLAVWVLAGPEVTSKGTATRVDLLTFLFPTGAAIAGVLFGLLEPIADRSRLASMAVGVVALAPLVIGVNAAIAGGYSDWTLAHTIISSGMSLVLGGALGYGYSLEVSEDEPDSALLQDENDSTP